MLRLRKQGSQLHQGTRALETANDLATVTVTLRDETDRHQVLQVLHLLSLRVLGQATQRVRERKCYSCGESGHFRCDCPRRAEAPGRSQTSNTGTISTTIDPKELSEQQLEQLLAEKRLHREESLLPAEQSSTNIVNASCQQATTVGD